MASLLEALSSGFDTIGKPKHDGQFVRKLNEYKTGIVNEYMKFGINLNKAIAQIAKRDNLNDDQIQRIVEEVNNQVYLIKYNQMKNSYERDVVFDLASLNGVKEEVTGVKNVVSDKVSETETGEKLVEKKASWADDDGDSLNFLNHTSYEFGAVAPEVESPQSFADFKKFASELKKVDSLIKEGFDKVAESSHAVAEALIQYDRYGVDTQSIFDKMCKSASLNPKHQLIIKKAVTQGAEFKKISRALPEDYELHLEDANFSKVASEFSLGQYSFAESFGFNTASNSRLPRVVADGYHITDMAVLSKIAAGVPVGMEKVHENMRVREDLLREAGVSEELAEKIAASNQSGLSAFFGALTGAQASKAKRELKNAGKVLAETKNNPNITEARKLVDVLENSKVNIDAHPRMSQVNKKLQEAVEKKVGTGVDLDKARAAEALKPTLLKNPHPILKGKDMSAQAQVNSASKYRAAQEAAVKKDLANEIALAKEKLRTTEQETGLTNAKRSVEEAQRIYEKAVANRGKARTTAAIGAGGAYVANDAIKKKKENDAIRSSYYGPTM